MTLDVRTKAMLVSGAVAGLMLVGKLGAYGVTGSAAILSDAIESVIHVAATAVAGFSLWFADRPATKRHPYGHGKMAFFSAGFEGALIFAAAVAIFWAATVEWIRGPQLSQLDLGLAITAGLAAVNLALGLYLVLVGKRHNSMVLVANGTHVLTDMWTSVGVVVGVALVWLTEILWLDPVVAMLAGTNILWSGVMLMRRSFQGLLDEAPPEATLQLLAFLDEARKQGEITDFHQLRHRRSDRDMWIELHILLPGTLPLKQAHLRVTSVEEHMRALFPQFQVHVTSHIEPERHAGAHPAGHGNAPDPLATATTPSGDATAKVSTESASPIAPASKPHGA